MNRSSTTTAQLIVSGVLSFFDYWVALCAEIVAAIGLTVTVTMIVAEVVFRYILHSPLAFTEETAIYSALWTALLGAALAVRRQEHFQIVFLLDRLPPRVRRPIVLIGELATVAFMIVLLVTGLLLLPAYAGEKSPGAGLPLVAVYATLPVSAALMLLFTASRALNGPGRPLPADIAIAEAVQRSLASLD